jgi:hypothetical protein
VILFCEEAIVKFDLVGGVVGEREAGRRPVVLGLNTPEIYEVML